MAAVIEAKSLSSITALAAEPPTDPPTKIERLEPLTLYIARVPGSQDVFLTTMKPRDKVVSAYDVESSLYYCHFDSVEDDAIRASLQDGDEVQSLLETRKRNSQMPIDYSVSVRRKSLSQLPLSENVPPQPTFNAHSHLQTPAFSGPRGSVVERKAIGSGTQRKSVGSGPALPLRPAGRNSMTRNSFGPRPIDLDQLPEGPPPPVPPHNFGKENLRPQSWDEAPPTLPPRINSSLDDNSLRVPFQAPALPPRRPTNESLYESSGHDSQVSLANSSMNGFSLTLIRRDPSSGDQWNIGKIAKDATNPINISIHTPGYDKFLPLPHPQTPADPNPSSPSFTRTLITQRQKEPTSPTRRSKFRSSVDIPRHSAPNLAAPPSPGLPSPSTPSVPTLCFLSPWNGLCEFSTGASGRTLKCRHSPPSHGNDVDPTLRRLNSSAVSELRLNTSTLSSTSNPAKRPPSSASSSRTSFFGGQGHRHSVSADGGSDGREDRDEWDDAEEERMDLSLGREKAGGGFGGKKAKLGKLIVEGEGLLMLDLVVAVNLGFWWSLKHGR